MPKSRAAMEREWQAQADLSALRTAEAIRADKTRVAAAKAMAQKEVAALKKVVGGGASRPGKKGK